MYLTIGSLSSTKIFVLEYFRSFFLTIRFLSWNISYLLDYQIFFLDCSVLSLSWTVLSLFLTIRPLSLTCRFLSWSIRALSWNVISLSWTSDLCCTRDICLGLTDHCTVDSLDFCLNYQIFSLGLRFFFRPPSFELSILSLWPSGFCHWLANLSFGQSGLCYAVASFFFSLSFFLTTRSSPG